MDMHMETTHAPKPKRALFALRAVIAFVLLGLLMAGLYYFAFNGYRTVAEWGEPGDHSTLIYEEETYELVGVIGKKGLNLKKYPIDKILGQVRDDGLPKLTETEELTETEPPEDEPEETPEGETTEEETEPVTVIPPKGAELFESNRDHAYVLYSVQDQEDYLLVLEPDGEYYLYCRVTEETTAETTEAS